MQTLPRRKVVAPGCPHTVRQVPRLIKIKGHLGHPLPLNLPWLLQMTVWHPGTYLTVVLISYFSCVPVTYEYTCFLMLLNMNLYTFNVCFLSMLQSGACFHSKCAEISCTDWNALNKTNRLQLYHGVLYYVKFSLRCVCFAGPYRFLQEKLEFKW